MSISLPYALAVWRRNAAIYKRTWKWNILPNFFEPVLYLFSIGIGVGAYVSEMGGTTYLDNSLVYWGNELGFNHIAHSVPCLLAGSAGGFVKAGRYLDYIDWEGKAYFSQEDGNVIKGIPHNRFLVTALQAMGLSAADYERDGAPGYGSTSTSGRDGNLWPVDYDMASVGQILPGIQG